jgi:hypothetical protein
MKIRTILLTVVLIFAIPAFTNAQVGNLLKNKVGKVLNAGAKALDKEAGNKVDTAAQKQADKISTQVNQNTEPQGQGGNQTGNQQSQGLNLGGLLGGNVTSKYNESYSFKNRIYMQMEIYDKKEITKQDVFIYFNDSDPNAAFEMKVVGTADTGEEVEVKPVSIFDAANKCFMFWTDMGTVKMGMISQMPDETTAQVQPAENAPKIIVTKTGNTKVIAGYKCDEYIYKEEGKKEYGKIWATKDLRLKADKRTFSKAGLPASYGNTGSPDEITLATESYNAKNELESKTETKEVSFNSPKTISTSGVSFRQINFNQAGGQQKK